MKCLLCSYAPLTTRLSCRERAHCGPLLLSAYFPPRHGLFAVRSYSKQFQRCYRQNYHVVCIALLGSQMEDKETAAIVKVCSALSEIEDVDAQKRIIAYAASRYGYKVPLSPPKAGQEQGTVTNDVSNKREDEIPGIAQLGKEGELRITVRDIKGTSANDAARRLAYITIRAYERLTGSRAASSRKIVTPALQEYRLYTGNTRSVLSADKGIQRNGDMLSLDAHATQEADRFIADVLNPELTGSWKPSAYKVKKSKNETAT